MEYVNLFAKNIVNVMSQMDAVNVNCQKLKVNTKKSVVIQDSVLDNVVMTVLNVANIVVLVNIV